MKKIFLFIAISILASCSNSKKITTFEKEKASLASTKTQESNSVKKADSSGIAITEHSAISSLDSSSGSSIKNESSETITVHLDTSKKVNDFEGAPAVFEVNINGNKITSNKPIKDVVVKNKNGSQTFNNFNLKKQDSSGTKAVVAAEKNTSDSTNASGSESLNISSEKEKGSTTKTNKGFSLGSKIIFWVIAAGLVFCGFYFGWFGRIFTWFLALLKRKKNEKTA
jgi:hypothetical protein